MTITVELHRHWDRDRMQTTEIEPLGSTALLFEWHIAPHPIDALVPAAIAAAFGRVLVDLGRVAFRWQGAPAWSELDASVIAAKRRSLLDRIADRLIPSWPTDIVVTRSAAVAEQLFAYDWDQQGQAVLVLDPAAEDDTSALEKLAVLRDWRAFPLSPPVRALIAPIVDGGGLVLAAGSDEDIRQIIDPLARAFTENGISFVR